jgi:hypothetical protein
VKDLHETVGIAMVVDGAALAGRPYEHELYDTTASDSALQGGARRQRGVVRLVVDRLTRLLLPLPSSTRLRV